MQRSLPLCRIFYFVKRIKMNKCQAVYFIVLMTLLSCGSYTNHYDTFRKMHYSEEELAQQKTKNDSSF